MSKIYIGTTLVSDNGAENISNLVDGAPEALNTLRELAENFDEGIKLTALSDVEIKDGKVGTISTPNLANSVRAAGTYAGLNSSSSLSGTGAKFNVVIHQSIVLTIDTSTLSSQTDSNRPASNYEDVTTEVSPAGGTGLTFDVLVNSSGAVGLTIVDRGTGYSVGDTITISNSDLGNATGVADVTFTVATLTSNVSSVTVHTAGTGYVVGETITITEDKFGQAGTVADNLTFDLVTLADSGIMIYDATAAGTVADPHFINQTFEEIGIPRLAGPSFTGSTSFDDLVVSRKADFNTLVTIGANTNISNGGNKILFIGDGNQANTGSVTGKNTMLSVGKDNVMNAQRIASIGEENEIGGDNSLTVGKKNITKRSRNIALGEENIIGTATSSVGNNAIAIGYKNTLEAGNSFIAGNENKILNPDLSGGGASAILGTENEIADGFNNFLIGKGNSITALLNYAIGIGRAITLSGENSVAVGTGLKDFDDNNTIMLGQFNADPDGQSKIIIGSGYSESARFTAIEFLARGAAERRRSKIIVNSLKHDILNSYDSDSLAGADFINNNGDPVPNVASGELDRNNSFVMVRGDTSLSTTNKLNGGLDVTGDLVVDTDTLKVDSTNDRVGINVASPTSALHVKDTSAGNAVRQIRIHNDSTSDGTGTGIAFTNSTSETYVSASIDSVRSNSNASGTLVFSTRPDDTGADGATIARMTINDTGEVGIGKIPDSGVELDVSGDIKASGNITVSNTFIGDIDGNLVGTAPTAPTAASGTNTTQIATTAFVQSAVQGEDTIAEMNDVTLTSLADGELLVSSSGNFINQTLAEAGIAPTANPTFSGTIAGVDLNINTATFNNGVDFDDQTNFNGGVEFGDEVIFNGDTSTSFDASVTFNDELDCTNGSVVGLADLFVGTNLLSVDSSLSKVGIGTVTPEKKLDVRGDVKIQQNDNTAASLIVKGPATITHDLFKHSGVTGGFADNSNHYHTVQKINRITQQVGSNTANERVQEQYYAIEGNNLKNSQAAFWNWHRVSPEIANTSVSLTNLVGWDVSDIQDSSNRTATSQALFPAGGAEPTEFTFNSAGNNPFTLNDVLQITVEIDFEGAIVAATNFAKVTGISGAVAQVTLHGGNYKTTVEVPDGNSQTAVTSNFSVNKIDTTQIMPLASSTGINVLTDTTRTTTTDTFKLVFASAHNLELNDVITVITDATGGFQPAESAFVKNVVSTTEAIFVYGRVFEPASRLALSDIGSSSVVGILKGTLDGLHRFTAGDSLMHFNADNQGRYKSYQIGPGSEVGADCIAIGKNVYNKDASTIKIGYDNSMLNIDSAGIDVAGEINASGDLHIAGDCNVDGDALFDGSVEFSSALEISGGENLEFTGGGNISGNCDVDVTGSVQAAKWLRPGVYANAAARDAAITSPQAGMMVFVTDGDGSGNPKFQGYTGSAWVDFH